MDHFKYRSTATTVRKTMLLALFVPVQECHPTRNILKCPLPLSEVVVLSSSVQVQITHEAAMAADVWE